MRRPQTPSVIAAAAAATLLAPAAAQPSNPECTGVMALRSASGAASGPWEGPTLLYAPSAPGAKKEWFSGYGSSLAALWPPALHSFIRTTGQSAGNSGRKV